MKRYQPEMSRHGIFSCQVCIPKDWTDKQAIEFAEKEYPCGTENGWFVRKEGHALLNGDPERVDCLEREGFIHIMLDA